MGQKGLFITAAIIVGSLFSAAGVPAGWLFGALLAGIFTGLFIKRFTFEGWPFQAALALVGVNIGFLMDTELFAVLPAYIMPLIVTLSITLMMGLVFGMLMYRWTNLDVKTAFFCCVPGGASEVISVSRDYGADDRIVAAFHTARITFFVFLIPLSAAVFYPEAASGGTPVDTGVWNPFIGFPMLLCIVALVIILNKYVKIPGGALLYALIFGFIIGNWVVPGFAPPGYAAGAGQALIGAMVGIRFDRETLLRVKSIGLPSLGILQFFLLLSLLLAGLFTLMTPLPYITSLLSTVPAGAAEMSSTAFALQLEPTLVSALHIIRVIVLFLLLPFLVKWIDRMILKNEG